MKIFQYVKGRLHAQKQKAVQRKLMNQSREKVDEIFSVEWGESLKKSTEFYLRCFYYFHSRLPSELREHRHYFESEKRGFGEKAFHAMWFLLFREFRPKNFLEIGVYRGQTLSLAALLSRHFDLNCFVQGISPFTSAGDAVSKYRSNVDYHEDTLKNFAHFNLPAPSLLKAFSTDEAAKKLIASRSWSFVYIDGNHDYEIARQDWELCAANLQPEGIIVLDDSGLGTHYTPPIFATGGHPGPSQLAKEIDRNRFREILQVGHNRVFQKIS